LIARYLATTPLEHFMTNPKPSLSSAETANILLENQKINNDFIRHYEDVRFKITQVTVTLSALLIGASRFAPSGQNTAPSDHPITRSPIALFVIALGLIGIFISLKYSERADRHGVISRAYRRAVSDLVGAIHDTTVEQIHQTAASRHAAERNFTNILRPVRARFFWVLIHAVIVALGILIIYV
jgi:hypothetical protein